jgi:hypothetical protein
MVRFPPRVVSTLCAIQTFLIVLSYVLTRSFHRLGTKFGVLEYYPVPLPSRTILYFGPWLLLVPLAWGIIATLRADTEGGLPEITQNQTRVGYGLLIAIGLLCILSVVSQFIVTFAPIRML